MNRTVAAKLLTADLVDPDACRRFTRECEVLGRLGSHRHIIDIYDGGVVADGRPFIVMPFYPRGSLAGLLEEHGTLLAHEFVDLISTVALALQTAHDRGVVNRDIQPQNLPVDSDGVLVLADFGVSAATGPPRPCGRTPRPTRLPSCWIATRTPRPPTSTPWPRRPTRCWPGRHPSARSRVRPEAGAACRRAGAAGGREPRLNEIIL